MITTDNPIPVRDDTSTASHDAATKKGKIKMSADLVNFYRTQVKRMGRWAGVRYLRNRNLTLNQTYFVMFNRLPPVHRR